MNALVLILFLFMKTSLLLVFYFTALGIRVSPSCETIIIILTVTSFKDDKWKQQYRNTQMYYVHFCTDVP